MNINIYQENDGYSIYFHIFCLNDNIYRDTTMSHLTSSPGIIQISPIKSCKYLDVNAN